MKPAKFKSQIMKVTYSIVRMGLFCILLFLASTQKSRAAGLTLITHGFEFDNNYPAWVDGMGDAIAARSGLSTAVYNIQLYYLLDGSLAATLFYEGGIPPSASTTNAEVIIKLQCLPRSRKV